MKLTDLERAMRAGELGRVPQIAIEHQIQVGEFFGAEDFVPVTQAHVMADTESLGQAGVQWLESLTCEDRGKARVRVPTITDPRGTDFAKAGVLKHAAWMLDLERRAIDAFVKLGVSMTDTCIHYQTIQAPTRGESVASAWPSAALRCSPASTVTLLPKFLSGHKSRSIPRGGCCESYDDLL